MFVPQCIQTQIELSNIADVKKHIISPRYTSTIIKLKQDTVIGSFIITQERQLIDWHDAMNLIMNTKNIDKRISKEPITSKKLFSMIIPNKINVNTKDVEIVNGTIKRGRIGASILNDKIINYCWDRYGHQKTKDFIDNSQLLICNYLLYNGFTVGVMDSRLEEDKLDSIQIILAEKKLEAEHMITEIENNPDLLDPDIAETQVQSLLETVKGEMGKKVMQQVNDTNNFYTMIASKAKGADLNMGLIAGSLGQDVLKFARIEKKVNNRTIAHYCQHDDRPEARGFITNSYFKGLTPTEFFFHHMVGREGLIDTAIKSVTGETEIVIIENSDCRKLKIGDWIDNLLDSNLNKVKKYEERDMELLELSCINSEVYIPTTDSYGKVTWSIITAITRHDPGLQLYEIVTRSGRKVIVTESKSLLIWSNNKLERRSTPEVKIGDKVPITNELSNTPYMGTLIKVLDYEISLLNGLFIGYILMKLSLIENKLYINSIDKKHQNFVIYWLNQNGIRYRKSNTMFDYIRKKMRIMILDDKFTNKVIKLFNIKNNKSVDNIPYEFIFTSNEFIEGLIKGILKASGKITNKGIIIKVEDRRLIEDINFYLTTINLYGSIVKQGIYIYNINFAQKVNNIILDDIIEINKIDVKKYPKVYDLTVPETLNFGLANGLHVVDTADSGYLQRKLIKGLEDIYSAYDGTVRSANNVVIQFFYGDNMLDQQMQKRVKLNILSMSNTLIKNKYYFTTEELVQIRNNVRDISNIKSWNDENLNMIINYRDELRKISAIARLDYITLLDTYYQPANYERIIDDAKNNVIQDSDNLEVEYILEQLDRLLDPLLCQLVCINEKEYDMIKKGDITVKHYNQMRVKYLFKIALHEYLSPKRCIIEYRLNKKQFDQIILEIVESFEKSVVEPGEMVGILTGQSLGEPLTQLTLNTFHSTGTGVKGMQGIPRFRELLSYTKKPSTPFMTIYLKDEVKNNREMTNKIVALLKYTILFDMADKIDVIYDPEPYNKSYIEEDDIVNIPLYINNDIRIKLEMLPWLFRIEINREILLENNLTLLDIKSKFISFWIEKYSDLSLLKKIDKDIIQKVANCCILSSNDNSKKTYIHIRFELNEINNYIIDGLNNIILKKYNIKGNENISKVDVTYNQQVIGYGEDQEIINGEENILFTNGIDMLIIRNIKNIDLNRTICNDIDTIYNLYGIEATRSLLINEFSSIFNEASTNYTHINLLVDIMTNNGSIVSIDRHGLSRLETDPLGRVSFEKTIEQLLAAAVFGEKDYLKGVSSRVMVGKCIKGGTGLCDLVIDTKMIEAYELDNSTNKLLYSNPILLHSSEILDDIMKRDSIETQMPFI